MYWADAFHHHAVFCWVEKLIVYRSEEVCGETELLKAREKKIYQLEKKKSEGKIIAEKNKNELQC